MLWQNLTARLFCKSCFNDSAIQSSKQWADSKNWSAEKNVLVSSLVTIRLCRFFLWISQQKWAASEKMSPCSDCISSFDGYFLEESDIQSTYLQTSLVESSMPGGQQEGVRQRQVLRICDKFIIYLRFLSIIHVFCFCMQFNSRPLRWTIYRSKGWGNTLVQLWPAFYTQICSEPIEY